MIKRIASSVFFMTTAAMTMHAQAATNDACSIDIEGRPGKQFSLQHITVPAQCTEFSVRLIHVGKNSKEEAGHNWVLTTTKDIEQVVMDGMQAGALAEFVPVNDSRILARTAMLGGGETAVVTFPVSRLKAGESYTYYCSFPSHAAKMRGTLTLAQ